VTSGSTNFRKKFNHKVYQQVKKIPLGKVVTYGQVAAMIGHPGAARAVGNALHYNPFTDVPCHRVVNFQGRLAYNFGKGGPKEQRERLLAEGVEFVGRNRVDLRKHQILNF